MSPAASTPSSSRRSTVSSWAASASPIASSGSETQKATFDADRIVVFSHPEGDRDYREDEGLAGAEARFGVPVTHALISR